MARSGSANENSVRGAGRRFLAFNPWTRASSSAIDWLSASTEEDCRVSDQLFGVLDLFIISSASIKKNGHVFPNLWHWPERYPPGV
tara:strand:- start:36407 stop:36664 length:258 start_codon:yes stop_codon:yes gene_type:complete